MILSEEERAMVFAHREAKECASKVIKTAVAKEDIFFPSSAITRAHYSFSYMTTTEKDNYIKSLSKKSAFKLVVPKGASFHLIQYSYASGFNVVKSRYWKPDDPKSHNMGTFVEEKAERYLSNIQELDIPLALEGYKNNKGLI